MIFTSFFDGHGNGTYRMGLQPVDITKGITYYRDIWHGTHLQSLYLRKKMKHIELTYKVLLNKSKVLVLPIPGIFSMGHFINGSEISYWSICGEAKTGEQLKVYACFEQEDQALFFKLSCL